MKGAFRTWRPGSLRGLRVVWIAVSNSRQKIYGNKHVLLDDNQEFQIELYNPTSIKYLAKIYVNGKIISYSGLVLKPGQRYFLDRFIDEDRKLLFSIYEVEGDNEEVQKAIAENGFIKVEFYAEDTTPNNCWSGISWVTTSTPIYYYSGNPFTTTTASFSTLSGNITNTSTFSSSTTANVANAFVAGSLSDAQATIGSESKKMKETGRVEKGSRSDQSFGNDYSKYSWAVNYISEYQILPRSAKPVEISEIRSYCPGCRTRIKKKTWKFCPSCGESLD